MQFDVGNPSVEVVIVEDRPTMIEFKVPHDGFDRPEAVLFHAVGEYLGTVAFEQLDVDAFSVRYLIDENDRKLVIGTLFSKVPLPWIDYRADGDR